MQGAGRLGDNAFVPSDAHGCLACAHPAQGPSTAGSPNVLINNLSALRVDDPGIHTACCGPNQWQAQTGARTVLINDRPAHRQGDQTRHCGGTGQLIEGSSNVFIGEGTSGSSSGSVRRFDQAFILRYEGTQQPVRDMRYRITLESGRVVSGTTDAEGHTALVVSERSEIIRLELLPDDDHDED